MTDLTPDELAAVREKFIDHLGFDPNDPVDLHPDLTEFLIESGNEEHPVMLKHPLVFDVLYIPVMNALYNKQYEMKKEDLVRALENHDWYTYVFLHERPYRVGALTVLAKFPEVTNEQYWELVGQAWIDSENITENPDKWAKLLKSKRPGRHAMMNEEERVEFDALPKTVRIFQGHTSRRDDGWSWTTNHDTAVWFAKRFASLEGGRPAVSRAEVHKSDITAYITRRGEYEVIVNPARLLMRSTSGLVV